jgi:hypothetical protein
MSSMIQNLPRFWLLAGTTLLAVLLQVYLLVVSRRRLAVQDKARQRATQGDWSSLAGVPIPSWGLAVAGALAPLCVAAVAVTALQTSRGKIWQAVTAPGEPADKAQLLSEGMAGDLNGLMVGLTAFSVVLALAAVAVGLAATARLRARGLARASALSATEPEIAAAWARHPGPAPGLLIGSLSAFVIAGVGPMIGAASLSGSHRIKTMADLVGTEPSHKGAVLAQLLTDVTQRLEAGLWQARLGALVAAAIAAGLAIALSPARARARELGKPAELPGRGALALAAGMALLAAALFMVAQPLQRENQTPWPPFSSGTDRLQLKLDTPALTGTDELERAPVLIALAGGGLSLNGRGIQRQDLEDTLWVLRNNFRVLHRDQLFDRRLVFLCEKTTPAEHLVPALASVAHAGYTRPLLTFLRQEETVRPLFGTRVHTVATATLFSVVNSSDEAEDGTAGVDAREFADCAALAARIVQLRGEGRDVTVIVGRP